MSRAEGSQSKEVWLEGGQVEPTRLGERSCGELEREHVYSAAASGWAQMTMPGVSRPQM